ncbi:DUF1810 family protein [Asticcacaulis sp. BYS171W]|uniref:DUF1810 family protein n=1 Tax=Asticcacaulis aquaticus TaxID=2984212 RepID=A0ABT5HQ40_9CAUL|nr:DUF1810 family protein [Asticcacaulis aquaticus]
MLKTHKLQRNLVNPVFADILSPAGETLNLYQPTAPGHAVAPAISSAVEKRNTVPSDLLHLFGSPDDLKFRSSLTLFAQVANPDAPYSGIFQEALIRRFGAEPDPKTVALIARMG